MQLAMITHSHVNQLWGMYGTPSHFRRALSLSTTALAADALVIKPLAMVRTADGRRVGLVERVMKDSAGAPTGVQIIYRDHFVIIPVSTLSAGDKGFITTLTTAEVNKL